MQESQSVGRRIAHYRKIRGLTQGQLARSAGVSKGMLAKVETDKATPSNVWVGSCASALGIDAELLYGTADEHPNLDGIIPVVRRVLGATDLLPTLEPEPLDRLRPQVEKMMEWRHAASYTNMVRLLPDLVDQLLVAGQRDGADAYRLLTYAYRAANTLSHKMGHNDLSMLATDRMVWAAGQSGDPLLLATTQYVKAAALARIGSNGQAIQLTDRTIADVEPLAEDMSGAAVLCALHMRRAGLAATTWDVDATDTHYAEATELAQRVGDREVLGTVVGPTNLKLWELGSAVDLGRVGEAKKIASAVHLPKDFPRERAAHFYLDLARAELAAGRPDQAVDALQEARIVAPEYFRHSRAVKTAIKTTAEQQRRASGGLRALANYAQVKD